MLAVTKEYIQQLNFKNVYNKLHTSTRQIVECVQYAMWVR